MPDEEVAIRIALRDAAKFVRDANAASKAIGNVGPAAKVAGVGLASISTTGKAAGAGLRSVATEAKLAAAGAALLGAAGVKAGINYNASIEMSRTALTTLLGSQTKANEELEAGQKIAKESALLNFRDTARAQQMLIGTGVQAELTRKLLTGTADAMIALGRDPEEFQQVIRAFGQIQAKGKLMGDEVTQQLGEVFPAAKILKEELGLTADQLANLGGQDIDSTTALTALATGLEKNFGGAAEAAEGNWTALMAKLKDSSSQAFGAITLDTFNWAEKAVLPAAEKAMSEITKIFGKEGLSNEEKLRQAGRVIVKELTPAWQDVGDAISEADIPEKLGDAVRASTPVVLNAATDLAGEAAKAFVTGWLHSGPWAQFLTVAFLGNKLRKSDLGKALGNFGKGGGGSGGPGGLGARGSTPANPLFVTMVGSVPGAPGAPVPGKTDKTPRGAKAAKYLGHAAGPLGVAIGAAEVGHALFPNVGRPDMPTRGSAPVARANAGTIPAPGYGTGTPGALNVHATFNVDSRTVSKVTATTDAIEQGRLAASRAARG